MQKKLAIKLGIIGFIALLLLIPLEMISGKISERASYLEHAKREVAHSWTSSQRVLGSLIVVPYEVHEKITITDIDKTTLRSNKTNSFEYTHR